MSRRKSQERTSVLCLILRIGLTCWVLTIFSISFYCYIKMSVSRFKMHFREPKNLFKKKIMPKISWNRWTFHKLLRKSVVKPERETITTDIGKIVKTQHVKPIDKFWQRPEVLRTFAKKVQKYHKLIHGMKLSMEMFKNVQ